MPQSTTRVSAADRGSVLPRAGCTYDYRNPLPIAEQVANLAKGFDALVKENEELRRKLAEALSDSAAQASQYHRKTFPMLTDEQWAEREKSISLTGE